MAILPLETDNPSMKYSVPVRQLNHLRFGYQSFSMTVVAEFFIYNGFLVRLVLPSSEPFLNLKNLIISSPFSVLTRRSFKKVK